MGPENSDGLADLAFPRPETPGIELVSQFAASKYEGRTSRKWTLTATLMSLRERRTPRGVVALALSCT